MAGQRGGTVRGSGAPQADISALTNSTGATPDNTIENVPAATAAPVDTNAASLASTNTALTAIENNISDLTDQINDLRTLLRNVGLMA